MALTQKEPPEGQPGGGCGYRRGDGRRWATGLRRPSWGETEAVRRVQAGLSWKQTEAVGFWKDREGRTHGSHQWMR